MSWFFVFHVTLHFSHKSCSELHLGHPLLQKFLYTLTGAVCKVIFLKNLPIRTFKKKALTRFLVFDTCLESLHYYCTAFGIIKQ